MTEDLIKYVAAGDNDLRTAMGVLKKAFVDAKEYGSIVNVKSLAYTKITTPIIRIFNRRN